jgi:dimethylargininase
VTPPGRTIALTHAVGPRLCECALTFVARRPIDLARARRQHAQYRRLLESCGAEVRTVDVNRDEPDGVFVEDVAVVLDEVAIAGAMGTPSRLGEVERMIPVLAEHRRVLRIEAGRLEGGDVLRVGRRLFAGRSTRTDERGIDSLRRLVAPFDYEVVPVDVRGCLHLKTACTALDERTLIANPGWADPRPFAGFEVLEVAPDEPGAANTLRLGGAVCMPASQPRTAARVAARGFDVRTIDIGEFEKAEAGVTCLGLLFAGPAGHADGPGTQPR